MSRDLHPILASEEKEALFRQGIDLFNRGEHFAAHDAWEEIWRSTTPEPRELLQGLIQVAAALHQIRDLHRRTGPRNTLAKAREHLEPYAPAACGLDVAALLDSVHAWQAWLESPGGDPPPLPFLRVLDRQEIA